MQSESWFMSIKNIMEAFLSRDFVKCLTLIKQFLALLSLEWCKTNPLNEEQYNDLLDMVLLLRALSKMNSVGFNSYVNYILNSFESAILTYTARKDGNPELLFAAIQRIYSLAEGLWVGANYLYERGLYLDHSPLILSFELTEKGTIKLFGWTDNPEVGSSEAKEEEKAIADLKAEFEKLFIQKQAQKADILSQAELLFSQNEAEKAIKLLNQAIKTNPSIQKAVFELQAKIYEHLQQYSNVIDVLMKCMVLGTPKSAIKKRVSAACQQLLQSEQIQQDPAVLKRWQEFKDDF